ncbi:serine/threonine protein kinase [Enhygromyxa salina]|uniref:Serine/threonine protein kinase n=2 Tax=Enhygromyxa salina TaxID=215803 RepID=A0A0C2D4N4_9BACT|nr:serine/threonine protein kinase [Enhygromyxa salina]
MFGPLLPEYVGSVRILEEIGRGGMGTVYRGHDESVDRDVAVKLLTASDGELTRRLAREGRMLADLTHPNIVRVQEAAEIDCVHYIIMELVRGVPVSALIPLSFERAVDVARQVCLALAHAHARGIVHRDIKPSNILVEPGGRVKVTDFGLARDVECTDPAVTQSRVVVCTPGYAAPEVWAGAPLNPRMDVYAIGVLLLDMTCGREQSQQIHQIRPDLARVIRRATAVSPWARYADAAEMGRALVGVQRRTRRRRWAAALVPVAAGLVVSLSAVPLDRAASTSQPGVYVFRQGLHDYEGARDHWFSSRPGEAQNPDSVLMRTGRYEAGEFQAVLRFSDVFGDGPRQLARGTPIAHATLTLHLPSNYQYAEGGAFAVHQLLVDWKATDGYAAKPWNGGATSLIDLDDTEARAIPADDAARYVAKDGLIPSGTRIELDATKIVDSAIDGADHLDFLLRSVGSRGDDTPFIAGSRWYDPELRPTLSITVFH